MDISCDHVKFQSETTFIDNFIHLLHCAPQYFDKDEQIIKETLNKTVQFLIQMFNTFHKHTTALKLHYKQSYDKNEYSNLKQMCRLIQQLENDSCKITIMSQNVIKDYQKSSDIVYIINSKKPKDMIVHIQQTKLKANIKILLHLLNCKCENFSSTLEDPQLYVEQQSKQLEDQKKIAFKDLESYTKSVKSNANKKVSFVNEKSKVSRDNLVNEWKMKETSFDKNISEVKQKSLQELHSHKHWLKINLKENADKWEQNTEKCKLCYKNEIARQKSKMLLQINAERKKEENEIRAIFNEKCKVTSKTERSSISSIERRKTAEYKRITEIIATIDEKATSEINDSIGEASKIISKFEKELKKKEEAIIMETKRLHLQNLYQSTLIQLEYLEQRELRQMQLTKALTISQYYVDSAVKNIECYLYTADSFWKEIISKCSKLMKNVVAENFTRHDHLRINSPNKITEIRKIEMDQKSSTFKTAAQAFYKECSVFIDECSLTDEKVITARENILKLHNLATQHNT